MARILILVLSAWMASAAFGQIALAQDAQQAPPTENPQQQQSEPAPQIPPGGTGPVERAAPAPAAPAPAAITAGEPGEPRHEGEGVTEYWPPIRGYRLKVTDTLIAGFTALLFWTTWLLWRAIRRLVKNTQRNAERQLRAYLAVVPKTVGGLRPDAVGKIDCAVKNLGQTPAQKIRLRYNFAVLPNPLPPRHKFAEPSREISSTSALLPRDETVLSFNGEAAFTAQQIEAVSRNEARVYCWGHAEYQDIFKMTWRSRFSLAAGGEAFIRAAGLPADHPSAPPWSWEYGSGHNEIEEA